MKEEDIKSIGVNFKIEIEIRRRISYGIIKLKKEIVKLNLKKDCEKLMCKEELK